MPKETRMIGIGQCNAITLASTVSPFTVTECCAIGGGGRRKNNCIGHLPRTLRRSRTATTGDKCLKCKKQQASNSPKDADEEPQQYVLTLWALHCATTYSITFEYNDNNGGAHASDSIQVRTKKCPLPFPLVKSHEPSFVLDETLLESDSFTDCACSQGNGSFMLYYPPNGELTRMRLPVLQQLFYHGLFTLPDSMASPDDGVPWLVLLPNSEQRYVIDLQQPSATTEEGAEGAQAVLPFPWKHSSKMRRLIRSDAYRVVAQSDASHIVATLRRAAAYHVASNGSTWLCEDLIHLFGAYAKACTADAPEGGEGAVRRQRPKLLCVNLVRKSDGQLMSGCCGFALGAVYHDFTMFTVERTADGLGTAITKVLGEALQKCGYNLWYWGMKVPYMDQFEKRYGACNMSRDTFYSRWNAFRSVEPSQFVGSYLQNNDGLIRHYTQQ